VLRRLFAEGAPLRFEITTTNSIEAARLVAAGQVDVAMVSTDRAPGPDETLLCRQSFLWAAPRRPRGQAQPIRARLPREPLLRLGGGSQGRRILDELLGRVRLRPLSTIDVPSVSLMLSYARQGLGIGLVPALALRADDRAHLALEPADVPSIDVRLACRPTLKRTRPVGRVLEALVEEADRAAREKSGVSPRAGAGANPLRSDPSP
jgi:DNA-binding transcriptional LysR family regulator